MRLAPLLLLLPLSGRAVQYTPHGFGCLVPETAARLFCNASAPLDARIADLISSLTLTEKVGLMGAAGGDPCSVVDGGLARYGIANVSQLIEVTGAVSSDCYYDGEGGAYCPTVFPAPLALAASFNRSLWRLKGAVTGQEARAFNNLHVKRIYGNQVDLLGFGPDLNIIVDPRNGRNGENPSEDGYLTGQYALEYIRGAQEGEDSAHVMLALGVKHFALYQEETDRFASNQNVSNFDLLDSYLVPYATSFTEAGALGSMCAYDSINARPSCANAWLLTSMVREFWGRADAYTLSDCGAIEDQFTAHHTASSVVDATAQSVRAGCDGCAGTGYIIDGGLLGAVAGGALAQGDIDAALARLLRQRFRLGMFDAPAASPYTSYGPERINTPAWRSAAEGAAAQGAVLLRNDGALLPLSLASPALRSVAVVGPHAASQRDLLGDFYADSFCPGNNTPQSRAQGCVPSLGSSLLAVLGEAGRGDVGVAVERGVEVTGSDASGIPAALAAVASADLTLIALGYSNAKVEGEGRDHNTTGFTGLQAQLLQGVLAAAQGRPVVLLLVNAGQIALDSVPALPAAVVETFYPAFGMPAIVRQLFGLTNHWGRLPYTMYEAAFANATALGDASISGAPGKATRTYRYYTGSPTHVFGDGLSYAQFDLSCSAAPSGGDLPAAQNFSVALACASALAAGSPAGDQVLLVYHSTGADVAAAVAGAHPIPFSTLRQFDRVALAAGGGGGQAPSQWQLAPLHFALTNAAGAAVLYPGTHTLTVSGFGGARVQWQMNFTVTGAARVLSAPPPYYPA